MGAINRFLGDLRIWPGPILAVELVTTSRRTRYFFLRVLYAAAMFFALWVTHQETVGRHSDDINSVARFTAAFFATFGVMQLLAVLLIGPALAAGTIALERERRTMEYLFCTPLSNLEIVIGKLGGRVLQILCLVLSGVPVLALAMLLGGIAPGAIAALTAITLSTVLFVTMLSLAVSAWTAKARDAVIRAYLVFFCIWVLPILIQQFGVLWTRPIVEQFSLANPVTAFTGIVAGTGRWGSAAEPGQVVAALVRNQLSAGGIALALTTLFMRRVHLKESGKPARKRRFRLQFFRGQLGDNPMYWKELYAEPGSSRLGLLGYGLLALIFVVICGVTVFNLFEYLGRPGMRNGAQYCYYAISMSTFLNCCGLLLLTARAAGSITAESERDCWASLIATPLEGEQIIKAKILGSIWSLRGLIPFLAVVWLPALIVRPSFLLAIAFSLLEVCILAAFTATLGVRCSLHFKSTLRAMGAALATVIMVGGGYLMCCCPVAAISAGGGGEEMIQMGFMPCMPFLLAWPGIASVMFDANYTAPREFGGFLVAAVIGTIGYIMATLALLSTTIGTFDDKCGRTQRRSGYSPRPTVPPEKRLPTS